MFIKTRLAKILPPMKGATLVEFAITVPILLLCVLGMLETFRWLITRNILETSVNRAASLAAVIPDLDNPDITIRKKVIEEIRDTAKELASKTLVKDPNDTNAMAKFYPRNVSLDGIVSNTIFDAVEVDLPDPAKNQTLEYALNDNPITINVYATLDSMLPFIQPFEIKATRTFFRERRVYSSEPIPLDCYGSEIINGTADPCPCWMDTTDRYSAIDPKTGQCVCLTENNVVPDGNECVCAFGHSDPGLDGYCECTIKPSDCPNGEYPHYASCTCRPTPCDGNFIPYQENFNRCMCPSDLCSSDPSTYLNTTTCECLPCDNPKKSAVGDGTKCACTNPSMENANCTDKERFDPATCECIACPEGMFTNSKDPTQCTCDPKTFCKSNERVTVTTNMCTCTACPSPKEQSPSDPGACSCPQSMIDKCADNQVINPTTCACSSTCAGSGVRNPDDLTKCVCNLTCSETEYLDKANCKCIACASPRIQDSANPTTCKCDVTHAMETLKCSDTQYLNIYSCQCTDCNRSSLTAKTQKVGAPTSCECDVTKAMTALNCSDTQYLDIYSCQCTDCNRSSLTAKTQKVGAQTSCECDVTKAMKALNCSDTQYLNIYSCQCTDCNSSSLTAKTQKVGAPTSCECDVTKAMTALNCSDTQYLNIYSCQCTDCNSSPLTAKTQKVGTQTSCECDVTKAMKALNCSDTQYLDIYSCQCQTCSGAKVQDPSNPKSCICDVTDSSALCTENQYLDTGSSCSCKSCPPNSVKNEAGTGCTCSEDFAPNPVTGACECALSPSSCPADQYLDKVKCECVSCETGKAPNSEQTSCMCVLTQDNCQSTEYFSPETCSCLSCPENFGRNPDTNQCTVCLLSNDTCALNTRFDAAQCACVPCDKNTGRTSPSQDQCECIITPQDCPLDQWLPPDSSDCACQPCPVELKRPSPESNICDTCAITPQYCAPSGYPSLNDCSCIQCEEPMVQNPAGNGCVCPTSAITNCINQNKTISPTTCTCDKTCAEPTFVSNSGLSCECPPCDAHESQNLEDCTCSKCFKSQLLPDGSCCPEGMVAIGDKCGDNDCCLDKKCTQLNPNCTESNGYYTGRE